MFKKIVLAFLLAAALLTSASAALDVIRNHNATAADLPFPPPCFPHEVCPVSR